MANPFTTFRAKDDADAERHLMACRALVDVLQTDPRVKRVYANWRSTTGLGALIDQLRATTDADTRETLQGEFALTLYGAGVQMSSFVLPAFVTKDLRLPYPWLAMQLSAAFLAQVSSEASGEQMLALVGTVSTGRDRKKGRRARTAGGDAIRRNVEWFYRLEIQQPPDTIGALAREHIRHDRSKRKGDGRSKVQLGIARAKELLDLAEYMYTPPPK